MVTSAYWVVCTLVLYQHVSPQHWLLDVTSVQITSLFHHVSLTVVRSCVRERGGELIILMESNYCHYICTLDETWEINVEYCKTGFDSDSLTAAKIVAKIIAIAGFRYKNYTHYTLNRSCLPIHVIAIVRYHFYFLMSLTETPKFLLLSNPVLR